MMTRYLRLTSNLKFIGGHRSPLKGVGITKAEISEKVHCLGCGNSAAQAKIKDLLRCSSCRSPCISYCSVTCQRGDWKGSSGAHGVKRGSKKGGNSGCEEIQEHLASKKTDN